MKKILQENFYGLLYLLSLKKREIISDHYDCHVQGNINFINWCAASQIVKEFRNEDCSWLFNKSRSRYAVDFYRAPYQDHIRGYKDIEGRKIVIFQPYGLDADKIDEIKLWCKKMGLNVIISQPERSWHYCNHTWLVQIEKEGV